MTDTGKLRAEAIENARELAFNENAPDYLRALSAIALLEESGWTTEVAKLLGWDFERAQQAMLECSRMSLVNVTDSRWRVDE